MRNVKLSATFLVTWAFSTAYAGENAAPMTVESATSTVSPAHVALLPSADPQSRKAALKANVLLQRLASSDAETRKRVASDVYGSGENIDAVLEVMAARVEAHDPGLVIEDQLQDEIAWYLKALGASGKAEYGPLIEKWLESVNKHVASHAQTAARAFELTSKTGMPLLLRDKVRVLNLADTQNCVLVRAQEECGSMRGLDQCKYELGFQTMEAGGDAYYLVESGRSLLGRASMTADLYLCRGNYTKDDGSF